MTCRSFDFYCNAGSHEINIRGKFCQKLIRPAQNIPVNPCQVVIRYYAKPDLVRYYDKCAVLFPHTVDQ
jgi:hypothetical protein